MNNMYTIHSGEIVLNEKYGSSARERLYVKPAAQENICVVEEHKCTNINNLFVKIFLPKGYPDSVSKDYIGYQIWDTAQAFCSTITGTLATQEVLRGVGVGDTNATPLAATVTWVIKDGCGHIGRILFAYSHGTSLDAYSKKWRIYADTLNNAAMCIEIVLPYFKNYTTIVLCISTVMKAIVGVAGSATRAAMTEHHSIRGNRADVSAKDSAQETAVNLIASMVAVLVITLFGNSITIFIIMMILHIAFNYCAVRAVCLRTLNESRFLLMISQYLREEVIASPCAINRTEPIIFYQLGPNLLDLQVCGFEIKVGCSVKKFVECYPNANFITNSVAVYSDRNYIILPNIYNRKMYVLILEDASTDDILCSYFHAVLLSIIICSINDVPLAVTRSTAQPKPFARICATLQAGDWCRELIDPPPFPCLTYNPSVDLMKYVDNIVHNEWQRIRGGLLHIGWDLSKHLIMADEWRVRNRKFNPINIDTNDCTAPLDSVIEPASRIVPFENASLTTNDANNTIDYQTFSTDPSISAIRIVEPAGSLSPIKEEPSKNVKKDTLKKSKPSKQD